MTARLASDVTVSALLRRVEQSGGFGVVLNKGDPTSGAILIVLLERGQRVQVLERLLQPDGKYAWGAALAADHNDEDYQRFLARRRRFDQDSWLLELDTASAERFAAELAGFD